MRDALEHFYKNELNYIRQLSLEFARDRPKIADRLVIDRETGGSSDPHVERLIEAFAFLTARTRLKIEDEFPEISDALLDIVCPHYLAPIPSMTVVQMEMDSAQGNLADGYTVPRGSMLFSREVKGIPCRFRTCYPVTLWPLELEAASYMTSPFGARYIPPPGVANAGSLLRLHLRKTGQLPLSELRLDRLRFFLSGDDLFTRTLHERLFREAMHVVVRTISPTGTQTVWSGGPESLRMVGFERDEALLPYDPRVFLGYRLLTEFFTFPQKFLFWDLVGMGRLPVQDPTTNQIEILIYLTKRDSAFESRVNRDVFRLGCTPAINLFHLEADPIRVTHSKYEYRVTPDVRHPGSLEVYSVDRVRSTNLDTHEVAEYPRFYSIRHTQDLGDDSQVYWHARRESSLRKGDRGTDVLLVLTDVNFEPRLPAAEVLSLSTTVSNRDLPGDLRTSGGADWQFQLQGQAPLRRIVPLVAPTLPARLPPEQSRWRLISHLALNHLSITDQEDGAAALRELLTLYDYQLTAVTRQQIEGIVSVRSRRTVVPLRDQLIHGFCRGVEIEVSFNEDCYLGHELFLFSAVLEKFFALYANLNSATRMVTRTARQNEVWQVWPVRIGDRTIV